MSTATDAVNAAYQKLLGRDKIGQTGRTYWENQWNSVYQNAKNNQGLSEADAIAAATANIERDIGASAEAKGFAKYGIAKTAIEGYEGSGYDTIDETADWFETNYTTDDPNEHASGVRDSDWASKLSTSNLENYLDTLNYQYGTLQGNTVGQEGSEWWGYQKTGAIDYYMSDAGGNYSFDTASKMADAGIARDISKGSAHENFIKYGSIGYGQTLDTKTAKEANVDSIPSDEAFGIDQVYLNFNQQAMDELKAGGLYAGSGFTSGVDDAGNLITSGAKKFNPYYIDDDGNVVTGDAIADDLGPISALSNLNSGNLITDESASGFSYVPDSSAPGGYRIIANPELELAKVVAGESSATGSDGTVVSGYMSNKGKKTFEIPSTVNNVDASQSTVNNVDASQFTLPANDPNKLNLSTWVENPANAAAVAAGDYSYKNAGAGLVDINGQLHYVGTTQQGGEDTNLGLNDNETLEIVQNNGKTTTLTGGSNVTNTTNTTNLTEGATTNNMYGYYGTGGGAPTNNMYRYYGMGGGNKTIIATPPPPSKTAKDQQIKEPTRIINQAPKRDQYNKIRSRGPAQIPGAGGGLSIPVG